MAKRSFSQGPLRGARDEERRQRIIRVVVSLFMVFLMLFATVAYFFQPDPLTNKYNGYTLQTIADNTGLVQGYRVNVDGTAYQFRTPPEASLDIALPADLVPALKASPYVVVLFDPADNLTPLYDTFRFELSQHIAAVEIPAVTRPSAKYSFMTLACANATGEVPFILLAESADGNRSITFENGCTVIRGGRYDFGLLFDRVLYRYHGITES